MQSEKKRTRINRDYKAIAARYNLLEKGRSMDAGAVTNITEFKRTLSNYGLEYGKDFRAHSKRGRAYVKRLSNAFMQEA